MALASDALKRRRSCPSYKGSDQKCSLSRLLIGLLSVIIVVSAVTGIVYLATRKRDIYVYKEWINVHLIPHSHDDVGWLKTPEEYYDFTVKWILSNVVIELQRNPMRKFVYVETYFFWKWWNQQTDHTKLLVKNLIKNGQLEIIGGGWTMSDEAVVHYQTFIDQSTWGFRRINDSLGPDAKLNIAWQIDTFGHSKELASLWAQMGFDALFFARIDVDDRHYRRSRRLMEFIWEANRKLGASSQIFTSVFYEHYSSPRSFDFELEPVEYEIPLEKFSLYARKHAQTFRTNNILVPMGDDFRFFNAYNYFQKLDDLIRGFNNRREYKLNVFYSTPSRYIEALRQSGYNWPTFSGDFFPYASEKYKYWTGYYTSRPALKYFERITNNFLQITKQLLVFAKLGGEFFNELTSLREAVGVVQHHDAVTGTAKQYVTDHYAELLADGIRECEPPVDAALNKLLGANGKEKLKFESCFLLNISECKITTESKRFIITVYNPLNRPVDHYVRVPVLNSQYAVYTENGEFVVSQMLVIPKAVLFIPGRESEAKWELLFKARNVPPMGFASFYVFSTNYSRRKLKEKLKKRDSKIKQMDKVQIWFGKNNLLAGLRINGRKIALEQRILQYISSHWAGAYIFQPDEEYTIELEPDMMRATMLNEGEIVTEFEQIFASWASQIIRIYKEEDYVEFEWVVGPIPIEDYRSKEIVVMYFTNIENKGVFYTDMNGRGMIERIKNYRDWGKKATETIGGNYYPVTSQIAIKDASTELHIVTDRPQGGASLKDGRIELMVHRRLCCDDGKGVNEPLSEIAFGTGLVARGKHWLTFGDAKNGTFGQRVKLLAQEKHSSPWLFFAKADYIPFKNWTAYRNQFSGLAQLTPPNIRVLTLEPWTNTTQLLRLEHIFEENAQTNLSASVTINLKFLFRNYVITEARETTLGANKWLSEVKRMNWFGKATDYYASSRSDVLEGDMTITIEPEHIRTFIIKMQQISFG